jgi:hypothetical protein
MSFARYNVLGNPFILPTGPSAHVTPAFPFLLGLIYKLVPDPAIGEKIKNLLSIGISSLQYALLPILSWLAGTGWRTGIVAGCVGAMLPLLYLECSGNYEAPLVALAIVFVCTASLALGRVNVLRGGKAFVKGVLWGLTALVSTQLVIVGLVYEVTTRLVAARPAVSKAGSIAVLCAGMVTATLPWTIRNYVELGSPIISRDNAGLELYVSNNDLAAARMEENMRRGLLLSSMHPHGSKADARLIQQVGEVKYYSLKEAQAVKWMRSHPQRFSILTVQRFGSFWLVRDVGKSIGLYCDAVALFGLFGAFAIWRRKAESAILFSVLFIIIRSTVFCCCLA